MSEATPAGPHSVPLNDTTPLTGAGQNGPAALAQAGAGQLSATLSANPPPSIATGNSATFALSVTNTGTAAWVSEAGPFAVGVDAASEVAWAPTIDPLPAVVQPAETVLLAVTITAGPTAGPFDLDFQVSRAGVALASATYSLTVPPLLAASVVGIPTVDSRVSGQVTAVEATVRNTGNTTWAPGDPHGPYLPSFSGAWWTPLATITPAGPLTSAVTPGDSYTYRATVVLPSNYCLLLSTSIQAAGTAFATGGPYTVQLAPASIEQVNATLAADPPTEVTSDTGATFSLSVTNTGTLPWYTGPGLYAVSGDSTSEVSWTPNIDSLPAVVQPGAVVSLSVTLHVPQTDGPQSLTFQMTQGGAVFATSPTYSVTISTPKDRAHEKPKINEKPHDKSVAGLSDKLPDSPGPIRSGGAGGGDGVPEGVAEAFIGSDERPRVGSPLYDRADDDSADPDDPVV